MKEPTPDDTPRPVDSPPATARGSFGSWLRHQREARSVSLREIADNSKISMRYLEALEQDRFDVLPAPVFARGFLREYARVVGLNADEVVNLYLVAVDEHRGAGPSAETPRASRTKSGPSAIGYGLLLAFAVVAFLAVAAFLSFYAERRNGGGEGAPPERRESPQAIESSIPVSSARPGSLTGDAAGQVADGTSSADPAAPLGKAPALPAPAAPAGGSAGGATRSEPEPIRLLLTFVQDCWLETVVDGRRRTSELRAAGETVSLEGDDSVVLTIGNASAVELELNGKPFALPASASRVVRDLRIDRRMAGLPDAADAVRP